MKQIRGKSKKTDFVLTGSSEHYVEPRNYQYHFKEILKRNKVKKFPIVQRDIRQTTPHSPIADTVLQSSKTVLLKKFSRHI